MRQVSINKYAWWFPRVLMLVMVLLLLGKVYHNAVHDPLGGAYRTDREHVKDLHLFHREGIFVAGKQGAVIAHEDRFLSWFQTHYRLGRAYAFASEHIGELEWQNEVWLVGSKEVSDEVGPLLRPHILAWKDGAPELDEAAYLKQVRRSPVGDHYYRAARQISRFHIEADQLVWDDFYLREANHFDVEPVVPRGRIYDGRGRELAGWEDNKRVIHEAPGTRHVVGASHWGGIERRMNEQLSGQRRPGLHYYFGLVGDDVRGADVRTSIDRVLSQTVYEAFEHEGKQHRGAAVVLEVATGRILAAVSSPEPPPGRVNIEALTSNPNKPLQNRAWEEVFFPGSTYKVVMAAGMVSHPGLEENGFSTDPNKRVPDLVRYARVRNHLGITSPKPIDLKGAMSRSSNTYFARLGILLGDRMPEVANRWGFNRELDLLANLKEADLKWETVPGIAYRPRIPFKKANDPLIAQWSIGQHSIKTHPLHMASIIAAIANDGTWTDPTLITGIRDGTLARKDPGHGAFVPTEIGARRELLSPADAAVIQKALKYTANGPGGTAYRGAQVFATADGYEVHRRDEAPKQAELVPMAGKTGTAQDGKRAPHAWFIGYAPADAPRYAVAVMVQNAGLGAHHAQPIAAQALAECFQRERVTDTDRYARTE